MNKISEPIGQKSGKIRPHASSVCGLRLGNLTKVPTVGAKLAVRALLRTNLFGSQIERTAVQL